MSSGGLNEIRLPSLTNADARYTHVLFLIYSNGDSKVIYRSAHCTDFNNPHWMIPDTVASCSFSTSSQNFVFHFYKVDRQNQAAVLSVHVDLSKPYFHPFETDLTDLKRNQIIYRLGFDYYVQTVDLDDIDLAFRPTVKPCIPRKIVRLKELSKRLELYKTRYTDLLKRFHSHYKETHTDVETTNALNILQVRLAEVQNQLLVVISENANLAVQLEAVNSQIDEIKNEKLKILNESQSLNLRLRRIDYRSQSTRADIAKMLQLCNLRRFKMIQELASCYPIEIVGRPLTFGSRTPNPSDYIMTICGLLLLESEAPGSSAAPAAFIDTGNGTLLPLPASNFNNDNSSMGNQESQRLSQSLRSLLLSNRPPTATAAILHVICLLQLLSTILNIPLKYPLDSGIFSPTDAFRPRITDPLIPCNDGIIEETFPLYAQRNNAAYRHAVYLLNQNIVALRAYFNLRTSNPLATLWNIRNLFEVRLLNVSTTLQRVVKGENQASGGN